MAQFSVNFYSPNAELQSADWGLESPSWSTSYREGICWYTACTRLTPAARLAVLEKFGLVSPDEGIDVGDEYPAEVLQNIAPAQLAERRRELEGQLRLTTLVIVSDRLGAHVTADGVTRSVEHAA